MPAPLRFGSEFIVSTQNANVQNAPAIARSVDGRIVVAWDDVGTNSGDIKLRLLNADGTTVGGEITANSNTAGRQEDPSVAFLADGKFVVVWTDFADPGGNVHYRVFNADGTPAMGADGIVGGSPSGIQQEPAVAARGDGSFVITWYDGNPANFGTLSGGGSSAVVAQAFDSAGTSLAAPIRVSGNWGGDGSPAIAASGNDLVVVWDDSSGPQSSQNGEDGIYFSTIAGSLPTSPGVNGGTRLDTNAGFRESSNWPDVAIGNLGSLFVWQDFAIAGADGLDVYARVSSAGGTLGQILKVNSTTASSQERPSVAALPQGGYVIVWQSFATATASDIMARILDAAGALHDEFLVTSGTFTAGSQVRPDVTALLDGRFMVTWSTGSDNARGIEAQIFDPRTLPVVWFGADDPLGSRSGPGEQYWGTALAGSGDYLFGGFGNDSLYGQAGADTISGGGGSDRVDGGDGNDLLLGDNENADNDNVYGGDDTIRGGDGNDTVTSGFGSNDIDGGLGVDTARYDLEYSLAFALDPPPVSLVIQATINLAAERATVRLTGQGFYGDPFDFSVVNDTIAGVENVIGTFGADSITGSASANMLLGGLGNDTLSGGEGNDTLDGGTGIDILVGGVGDDQYVVDDINDTIVEFGAEGTDTVISTAASFILFSPAVENLTLSGSAQFGWGNAVANIITGTTGINFLIGGDGNDTINALGGDDLLIGGIGNDALNGGDDIDQLWGSEGDDTLNGGAGDDFMVGGTGADSMTGGAGNDTYFIQDAGDAAIELGGEGNDTAWVFVSGVTVSANIETVVMLGSASQINGSAANDIIYGNGAIGSLLDGKAGDDALWGTFFNDTLIGGAGTDNLIGFGGADMFTFSGPGFGFDIVNDFSGIAGGQLDKIDLRGMGVANFAALSFTQYGSGATINFGTDAIYLYNVFASNLQSGDFVF
jgi:Ca2+-binding RTX toxin-like protein